ncbi:Fusaric acid resistance protein conserved region [Burkholderia sp. H160]|nr:Fusaric acid resistance protein conserved region [Burkholderia sp. H160]
MNQLDLAPSIFSLRTFTAAMIAYWVALEIGLPRPFWAVTTVYLVSQPLAGAVLSKSAYRLAGTILGAAAAVTLVPNFVNEPAVLSFVMAIWLGLCMFTSVHDHTPRAYTFLLAGYTTSIVGFPSVNAPGAMFDIAILRVQEIVIGILAAAFIHGLVLPATVTRQLTSRARQIRASAENWTQRALAGDQTAEFRRERQRLVVDINDLQELSYHLPFDTGRLVPRREVIRALQHELSFMVGEARATEDRISYLKEQPGGLPQEWQDIVKRIQEWVVSDHDPAYGQRADELIQIIHALEPNASPAWTWREMVVANLAGQLAALVTGHRNAFYLVNVIDNSGPRDSAVVEALLDRTGSRSFHTDSGLAARSALGAVMTVLLVCSFWIATAWRDGSGAALIAGVTCALFGSLDNPAVPARKFLIGSIVGCCLAAIYGFVVLPRVTDFILLGAVLAPTLLLFGSALARPQTATLARGVLLGFVNAVGLNATYSRDFLGFVNGAIAQNVAIAFAIVMFVVFRTLGGEEVIRRLRRAGFRDVIGRIQDDNSEEARWTSKMLDRISILITRTTVQSPKPGDEVTEALQDLRVGVVAGDLKALSASSTKRQQEIIDGVLRSLAGFFSRRIRNASERPAPVLLAQIEELATEFRADPQVPRRRAAVALAVSLRRDLFPAAELPGWTS